MSRTILRAVACLTALGAALSLTLGGTVSAYTASVTTASNAFTAAADWTAPITAAAVGARSTAYDTGLINQGATYYVYANVSDTGNPASGMASVKADVSSVTTGSTAVALTAGSYTGGGTAYSYRTAALTAGASLAAGSKAFTVTATDTAANVATQSFSTTVDNTAPTAMDAQTANVGATVGKMELGDTLTLTYSKTMDPFSILANWTGASTSVEVQLVDGGGTTNDSVTIDTAVATPVQIPLGTISLGSPNYLTTGAGTKVTFGHTGSATPSTMTRAGAVITIKLGTASAASSTNATAAKLVWTPSTTAKDIAGNASTATAATQSGAAKLNF
jgi:hypothetical protein